MWDTVSKVTFHSEQLISDLSTALAATTVEKELVGTPFRKGLMSESGSQSSPLAASHCQIPRMDAGRTVTQEIDGRGRAGADEHTPGFCSQRPALA